MAERPGGRALQAYDKVFAGAPAPAATYRRRRVPGEQPGKIVATAFVPFAVYFYLLNPALWTAPPKNPPPMPRIATHLV
jgi:hypothetical protein